MRAVGYSVAASNFGIHVLRAFSGFGAISRLPMGIFRILKRPNHLEMVGPFQDFGQSRDGPRAFSRFWNGPARFRILRLPRTFLRLPKGIFTIEALYYTEIDIKVLFTLDGNDKGLRGHSKKICKVTFNIDVRKFFFKWNNLDQDTVDAPSLNSFKNRLNKIRSTRMGFFMD